MLPSSSAAGQGCQQPNSAQPVLVFDHGPRVHAAHACVATLPVRPTMDTPTACADGEAPGGASTQGTHSSQARKRTAVGVQCQRVKRSRYAAADASARDSDGEDARAGALTQSAEPTESDTLRGSISLLPTRLRAAGGSDVDVRGSASSDKQDCVAMLPSSSAAGQGCQQPNLAQAVFVFGHGPRVHATHSCAATLPVRSAIDTPTAGVDGEAPRGTSSQGTHSGQPRKCTAVDVQCQAVWISRSAAVDAPASSIEPDVVLGDVHCEEARAGGLTRSAQPMEIDDATAKRVATFIICGVVLSDFGKRALLITKHGSRASRT